MEPEDVSFQILKEITNGFSEERKLGDGAFGEVYRGVTKNGEDVAVKKLRCINPDLDDKQFENEFYNLMKLDHNNIVQILGYCYETEQISIECNGRIVLAEETHRALCFEFMHNGSLEKHLSDEFCGFEWHIRYNIIKGSCEGLKYIHEDLNEPLYHLDLKPENILLDKDIVPKIADFGLSRMFGKELARTTLSPLGTIGYQPPEYIERGEISKKFDIFSLGVVIIKIISGPEGYSKCVDMNNNAFIDLVQRNWRNRLKATLSGSMLEAYCHQIETCTQIALNCIDKDSMKRPDIVRIINKLNDIEADIGKLPWEGSHNTVSGMPMHFLITKVVKEPKEITDQQQHFNFMTSWRYNEMESVDIREKSSDVGQEYVVGRTEEKNKILTSLLESTQKIIIIPIYGIGGIGKTTFAKLIYNDINFKHYSRVWVYVSPRFDLNKIGNSIISQLSGKESQIKGTREIYNRLKHLLSGEKILIVLDDLWEDNSLQLKDLKDMLNLGDSINTIVLVTTRNERVSEKICTNHKPYKVEYLTNDMCWHVIKEKSGFEARDDREQLRDIGWTIALKCGGVALAAQSLGYMLQSMNSDQWMKVKDSNIWNVSISEDASLSNNVLASLKLSYSSMSPCLRSCFTYCAVFPKGHRIAKADLIQQWISLGFITPTKLLSTMQLSEQYIVQLLGLSFLQHSVSPSASGAYLEDVTSFTMHDLVHDLARLIMGHEILDSSQNGNTGGSSSSYALLTDCSKPLGFSTTSPDRLKALLFLDCNRIDLSASLFSSTTSLCVLDLSECSIQVLPDSIGQLDQLRYLNAPGIQAQSIPECFTKLSKLHYLTISRSEIVELPESIGEMEGLMHFDLSCCLAIEKLPISFGNLKNLEHLDLSMCFNITGVSQALGSLMKLEYLNLSDCVNIGDLPRSFGNLTELQYLNLSNSSYLRVHEAEVLGSLTRLMYLNLSSEFSALRRLPEALGNFIQLKYLNLSGCCKLQELPRSFSKLHSLVHLELANCFRVEYVPKALSSLTKLQYLNLRCTSTLGDKQLRSLKGLEEVINNFTELCYLDLSGCLETMYGDQLLDERSIFLGQISTLSTLELLNLSRNDNLYSVPESLGKLDKLHTLDLSFCCNLQKLPASISERSSLRLVNTMHSEDREESILWPVTAGDGESSRTLEDKNPTILEISNLELLKSAEEARTIKLKEKRRIENLTLGWTNVDYAKRFVEDIKVMTELVPPRTLRSLKLQGYNSLIFPTWVKCIASNLPHLVEIIMVDLPMCNTLPPLGQLPTLGRLVITRMNSIKKIDSKFYDGPKAFPQLKYLDVSNMERLEEWDYTTNLEMFHRLWRLCISGCPKLTFIPSKPIGTSIFIRDRCPDDCSESVENVLWDPSLSSLRLMNSSTVRGTVSIYSSGTLSPAMENLETIHYRALSQL